MIENNMVLGAEYEEPIEEPQERDEPTDAELAENDKDAHQYSVTQNILDIIEGIHHSLDKMALKVREQAE